MSAGASFLFVYGTLRPGCDTAQARRLAREAHPVGPAFATGALYRVEDYPAFVPAPSGQVRGDLFRLFDPGTTLQWLDAYEECAPPFPEPWEYRRERRTVRATDGPVEAWVYVYTRPVDALPLIMSGDFLACVSDRDG